MLHRTRPRTRPNRAGARPQRRRHSTKRHRCGRHRGRLPGHRISPAGSGYYPASKAALEGLSGSLHKELQPVGINVTVIEPGAFRTDFAGRSLTQSATPIEDYAETAGKRRKENDTMHGTQPGDPAKAGDGILAVAESPNPPSFLVLGSDAFNAFAAVANAQRTELDQWRDVSLSTDSGGERP